MTENTMKVYDVEKRRMEIGENWGDEVIIPIHHYVTQYKAFFVVDTDDEIKVARWVEEYSPHLDIEVSPIIERTAYEKAKKKA